MFTLQQINDIHDRLGNADSLPPYLQALRSIGVTSYDSFVSDGHSEYYGSDGYTIASPAVHATFTVADKTDQGKFFDYLDRSGEGELGYEEMSKGFADCGIEKWTFDTAEMSITYYDRAGNEILSEDLED